MPSWLVSILPSLIALVASAILLYVGTKVSLRKERRQLLWAKEIDRFLVLEELAGQIVEEVICRYPIESEISPVLAEKLQAIHQATGRFARYPAVRQAIRELHHLVGRFINIRNHFEDDRTILPELDQAVGKLLEACDKAIGRKTLRRGGI
jgi:hypothetical protein